MINPWPTWVYFKTKSEESVFIVPVQVNDDGNSVNMSVIYMMNPGFESDPAVVGELLIKDRTPLGIYFSVARDEIEKTYDLDEWVKAVRKKFDNIEPTETFTID